MISLLRLLISSPAPIRRAVIGFCVLAALFARKVFKGPSTRPLLCGKVVVSRPPSPPKAAPAQDPIPVDPRLRAQMIYFQLVVAERAGKASKSQPSSNQQITSRL
jgi:hypothetical protein